MIKVKVIHEINFDASIALEPMHLNFQKCLALSVLTRYRFIIISQKLFLYPLCIM